MEVAVNGIPVLSILQGLKRSTLLQRPYTSLDSSYIELIFTLSSETSQSTSTRFLAASIFLRSADKLSIPMGTIALASLFLSSKYAEVQHLSVEDLLKYTEGRVQRNELLSAESAVMSAVDYIVRTETLYDWVSTLTLWISPYLAEIPWQALQRVAIQISELIYQSGALMLVYPPCMLTVAVLQAAVYILCKSVGICGLTVALAELIGAETTEIAVAGEDVLAEALGIEFLAQFTIQ
jgi:hypothetical protein